MNSMSDLFHEAIPFEFIERVFEIMVQAEQHTFQVLTKREERLAELAPDLPWPANVWMGVSIENRRFVHRADQLREVPAAVRFISAEPLLGPLEGLDLTGIDWLIAGGESGPGHRPVKEPWLTSSATSAGAGVAFFFKQWGGRRSKSGGRLLDGPEWSRCRRRRCGSGPLSRELADSDPEKWVYTQHAAAKHEILRRYLGAWLPILGSAHPKLVIYDGFAGRGRYRDGEDGSPVLTFKRACEAVDAGRPQEVSIRCVEYDRDNYDHLKGVIGELHHEVVTIDARHDRFDVVANEVADYETSFAGGSRPHTADILLRRPVRLLRIHLETLGRLLAVKRWEVLLTFMVRDMRRFLEQPNFEAPLTEFFGGDTWRECTGAEDREQCLLLRFSQTVRERGIARFATPFRVFEDARRQTLYYLVHLTNEPLGMREMKKAMVRTSPEMTFWPVTFRPPAQLALDTAEQPPYPELQHHLLATYGGQRMTFEELLNRDYPEGLWLEPQYRAAFKDMASREAGARIHREDRQTPKGRVATGLELVDHVDSTLSGSPSARAPSSSGAVRTAHSALALRVAADVRPWRPRACCRYARRSARWTSRPPA